MKMKLELPRQEIADYMGLRKEEELHEPFIGFVKRLVTEVQKALPSEVTFTDEIWDGKGVVEIIADGRTRKPDLLNMWQPIPKLGVAPDWAVVKHIIEMKKNSKKKLTPTAPAISSNLKHESSGAQSNNPSRKSATGNRSSRAGAASSAKRGTKSNATAAIATDRKETSSKGRKRPRAKSLEEDDNETVPRVESKRPRVLKSVSENVRQLAAYALETLASTSRLEPEKLALVLYAMRLCGRSQSGFDPRLRASPSLQASLEQATDAITLDDHERPVENVVGSCFEFPAGSNEIDPPSASTRTRPHCFQVTGWLRRPDDLIGRGTMVFKVRASADDGTFSKDENALKMSWPSRSRGSEAEYIKVLKEKLPTSFHDHLPNLHFAATYTAEQLSLPWIDPAKLGISWTAENHHERVSRVLEIDLYDKLWKARTIEEFKAAWLDCVECHHAAWKTGGILHRDLSENNLMLCRAGGGRAKGIVNDWDMAAFVERNGATSAHNRTGTPPFMAWDLVKHPDYAPYRPTHWYRHDLESFLYILIWAALHYNLREGTRDSKTSTHVKSWLSEDNIDNATAKYEFCSIPSHNASAARKSGLKPGFEDLWEDWITPLRRLFHDVHDYIGGAMHSQSNSEVPVEVDYSTADGRITFETFMKAINAPIRTWGEAQD
ncbi:hypothetical protein DFP72DRAFT_1177961 [Ephemerocybe angulata]|uniref:Protein kinase domain-containing protein n=1 Tax=Ephemerocybe angulata TaxID=980116 RepID=A0A8H6HC65_9AGAR|nr:hypothetical protein DFP72DRAFT_1177961 [Tulosesus angulatus]